MVALPLMPDLGTVNVGSKFSAAKVGAGLFDANAVRRYMVDTIGVDPITLGAAGDGTTNDTAKIQDALDTGRTVILPPGRNYKVTSGLQFTANNQTIIAYGATVTPVGAFDLFTASGGRYGNRILGGTYECGGQTGSSHVIRVSNADRFFFADALVHNPRNLAYVEQCNYCGILHSWVNNILGGYGVKWYGNDSLRSDVLWLLSLTLSSPNARATGVIHDGNVHTLLGDHVNLTAMGYGYRVQNTSGGAAPAFGFFDRMMIDYPTQHGVSIEAGEHYYFDQFYAHGGAASGVHVGSAVLGDSVQISGGKITGFTRYSIESDGPRVLTGTSLSMYGSTMGNLGTVGRVAQVFGDARFNATMDSGIYPTIEWDANDFEVFVRANDEKRQVIAGVAVDQSYATRRQINVPVRLAPYTVATLPSAVTFDQHFVMVTDRSNRLAVAAGSGWHWMDGSTVS